MRAAIAGLLAGLAALLLLDAAAVRLGFAAGALPNLGAPAWITSRAAGLAALVALTFDVVFGLFVSTGAADKWVARARSVELHRWLSAATLGLVALHALVLGADHFVRFDALDATVPFLSSYRRLAVALGVLAAYAAWLVHASFGWMRRIGGLAWRRLHYVSFAAFAGVIAHALLLGGDVARAFAWSAVAIVTLLVARRIVGRAFRPSA